MNWTGDLDWTAVESEYDNIEYGKGDKDIFFWNIDDDGNLSIEGNGRMKDYYSGEFPPAPWDEHMQDIKSVTIEEGVLSIGVMAFAGARNLECVFLPKSLKSLHMSCFDGCERLWDVAFPPNTEFVSKYEKEELKASFNGVLPDPKNTDAVKIGIHAFRGTPWAKEKWGQAYIRYGVLLDYLDTAADYTVPDKVFFLILAFISLAAAIVKVRINIWSISIPSFIFLITLVDKTIVFPLPAPADTMIFFPSSLTANACSFVKLLIFYTFFHISI